jgi:hypothetical protein
MSKLNWGIRACGILSLCATATIVVPAQQFTTLASLDANNGNPCLAAGAGRCIRGTATSENLVTGDKRQSDRPV